jgi:hypothetical protein
VTKLAINALAKNLLSFFRRGVKLLQLKANYLLYFVKSVLR